MIPAMPIARTLRLSAVLVALVALTACGGEDPPRNVAQPVDISQLHPLIASAYSSERSCKQPLYCNGIVRLECQIEVDGPLLFFSQSDGSLVMSCGDNCFDPADRSRACTCPPKPWTCGAAGAGG
jgi:hypothetical protein